MDVEKTTMEYLFRVEQQAEKILLDKSEVISLDKKRNNNRMAIRALMNNKPQEKTWLAVGPCLVKIPCEKAKTMLEEGTQFTNLLNILFCAIKKLLFSEQVNLDSRINCLRNDIKFNVNKLRDMEYKEPVRGLFLNPLTKKEMSAMNQLLGENH